jgi:hypothetical protein
MDTAPAIELVPSDHPPHRGMLDLQHRVYLLLPRALAGLSGWGVN